MRIVVNTRFLLKDQLEGIGLFTHEVFRRMVTDHPEDEFIFCFDRPYNRDFVYGDNVIPVQVFPPARHPVLFYIWFEQAMPKIFRRYRPDAFFSPDGFCCLQTNAPKTLLTIHDLSYLHFPKHLSPLMRRYYKYFTPRYIQKAEKIITVSNYSKADIIKNFVVEDTKIIVCPNGCREIFFPLNQPEKEKIRNKYTGGLPFFITVGAIHPRKNLVRLIESFNIFKQKTRASHKLILVGRKAWKTSSINNVLARSPFRKDIIITGYVKDKEVNQLIGSSFAFVYVSLWEGFGMPILEAMKCDVPVIASHSSALPETGGNAVLWVDPFSTSSISDGFVRILEDRHLSETLIKRGRIQRQKFNWNATSSQIYNQMKAVVSG